jgi:hypothetical protein
VPFGDERLVIVIRGSDGKIYAKEWENTTRKDWYQVNGGESGDRPKLVTISGELWLFIRGLDGVVHKTRYISEGVWAPWIRTSLANSAFNGAGPRIVDTSWGTWRTTTNSGGFVTVDKCASSFVLPPPPPPPAPQPILFDLHGYGWSPNIGWLSMNCQDRGGNVCNTSGYKVQVDSSTGYLKGNAWSSAIGWVKFDPVNTDDAPEAPFAPARLVNNKITGWARACAGTYYKDCISATRTDGWDGWIKLSPEASESQSAYAGYGLTKVAQHIIGFAWGGGDMLGWLKFCNPSATSGILHCGAGISCNPDASPGASDFCGVTVGTVAPVIIDKGPTGTLAVDTPSTQLFVVTNMSASCRFSDEATADFDDMTALTPSADGTRHEVTIPSLQNGNSYTYYVLCRNAFGDESEKAIITFSVDEPAPPPNFNAKHRPYWPPSGSHSPHPNPDMVMGNSDTSSVTTLSFEGIEGLQTGQVTATVVSLHEDRLPYIDENNYGDGNALNENQLELSKIIPIFDGATRVSKTINIVNGVGETRFSVRKRNIQAGRYIIKLRYMMAGVPDKFDSLLLIIGKDTPGYIEL